jgi:thioredoxin-related protein
MTPSRSTGEDLFIFTREGCSPCASLKRALASNPSLTSGFTVYMIDTKADPELAKKHRVKSVPTLVVLGESGKEIKRTTGYSSEPSLRAWLDDKQARRRILRWR